MEIISKQIPCRLISSDEFAPEDCEQLLNDDLRHLIAIVSVPIENLGSLKIEAFKKGFRWMKEKDWTTFTIEDFRAMKISVIGKWIQVNPNVNKERYDKKEAVFNLLSLMPNSFSIMLGNKSITIKELEDELGILPF